MSSPSEDRRNGSDIGAVFSGPHAVIPSAVPIMPDEAKRMFGGEPFSNLAGEYRALHGRNGGSLEDDQTREGGQPGDEFVLIAENRPSFLFEVILSKTIPYLEIKRIGCKGGADLAAVGELPMPEVLVLNVLQQPWGGSVVSPVPGQDGAGPVLVKICEWKAGQRLLRGDMMVQDKKAGSFFRNPFKDRSRITEIDDDDTLPA
jgi:hypothetical protein